MKPNTTLTLLLIVSVLIFLSGCTLFTGPSPVSSPSALEAVSTIELQNQGLISFKGIGTFNIRNEDQAERFRFAWAGMMPDKLRGIALISGKPIETIVTDGNYFYLKSHTGSHRFIKKRTGKINLERIISVPLTPSDIISILSGNIPVPDYTFCTVESGSNRNHSVVSLYDHRKLLQKIYIDDNKTPYKVERYKKNNLIYTLILSDIKENEGFLLPYKISIFADESECNISVDRHVVNPDLQRDTFTLSPE